MKRSYHVNISELRKRLSFYLGEVKKGFEVIVCKRNVPFAKIVRLSSAEVKQQLNRKTIRHDINTSISRRQSRLQSRNIERELFGL